MDSSSYLRPEAGQGHPYRRQTEPDKAKSRCRLSPEFCQLSLPRSNWIETSASTVRATPLPDSAVHESAERLLPGALTHAAPAMFFTVEAGLAGCFVNALTYRLPADFRGTPAADTDVVSP